MPPKAGKQTTRSRVKREESVASEPNADTDDRLTAHLRQTVITAFYRAQQSMSAHAAQRKAVFRLLDEHTAPTLDLLCDVCVKTLSMQQSHDVSRRHAQFLADLCKTRTAEHKDDSIGARVLAAVLPYHGAKDKNVRYAVCCLMEPLLRALDSSVDTDERSALLEDIVSAMKTRAFDVNSAVRERAIAALAIFHEGRSTCDATQFILAASCTDPSPAVRRQAAAAAMPREVYFAALSRHIRDVAAPVRKTAWESFSKFKFGHVVAYCQQVKLSFIDLVDGGLNDLGVPVRLACSHTVVKWLARDMHNDPVAFLSKIALPPTESPAVAKLAKLLLEAATKVRKPEEGPLLLELQVQNLTPANVIMWRVCCEAAVAAGDASEANVLPPLLQFSAVLRDAIETFVNGDNSKCKVANFSNPDHADHIIRILLATFPLYEEGGYLAHCDDQARASLLRNFCTLLKVVTDTEADLFAEDTMRSVRLIAERHPAQVEQAVNEVLRILFSQVSLQREHGLTVDDIEMFGRKDYERRSELRQMLGNPRAADPQRVQALEEVIETDTLYLLRMLHVVHQYLSFCKRGDNVPQFCAHFIQLGRVQVHEEVRGIALKALGLQCLLAPQTVHTFLPLVVADAMPGGPDEPLRATPSTESAVCVLFDLLCEYPPSFFASGAGTSHAEAQRTDGRMREGVTNDATEEERRALRDLAVEAIAQEDAAKVATGKLLAVTRAALVGEDKTLRRIAMRGYCKLLACGRLSNSQSVEVLAVVLSSLYSFEAMAAMRRGSKADVTGAFLYKQLDFFVTSFAASDPRRMRLVADASLLALRMICARQPEGKPALPAQRLARRLVFYTDAGILQVVREADPEFANRTMTDHQQQEREAEGTAAPADGEDDADATRSSRGPRTSMSVTSRGSARVWRLLSENSQHEYVAQELLLAVAGAPESTSLQHCCVAVLGHLRLYARDTPRGRSLAEYVNLVKSSLSDTTAEGFEDALDEFMVAVDGNASRVSEAGDDDTSPHRASNLSTASSHLKQAAESRAERIAAVLALVPDHIIPAAGSTRASARMSGRSSKQHRAEGRPSGSIDTSQDIMGAMMQSRRRGNN